jgi:hypothetical protein
MRDLTMRGLDAWITREPESSEPWGECEYCARRMPLRDLKLLDRIETCEECARDVEPPGA